MSNSDTIHNILTGGPLVTDGVPVTVPPLTSRGWVSPGLVPRQATGFVRPERPGKERVPELSPEELTDRPVRRPTVDTPFPGPGTDGSADSCLPERRFPKPKESSRHLPRHYHSLTGSVSLFGPRHCHSLTGSVSLSGPRHYHSLKGRVSLFGPRQCTNNPPKPPFFSTAFELGTGRNEPLRGLGRTHRRSDP